MVSSLLSFFIVTASVSAAPIDHFLEYLDYAKSEVQRTQQFQEYQERERGHVQLDVLYPRPEGGRLHRSALPTRDGYLLVDAEDLDSGFMDVAVGAWHAPYIRDAVIAGVLGGYKDESGAKTGRFGPDDPVTLEQLAKVALLAADRDIEACGSGDPMNVHASAWSAPYIRCMESLGSPIYEDGHMPLSLPASRAQVSVTVLHAFDQDLTKFSGEIFTDVTRSTPFARAIETAAIDGLLSGYTDENGQLTGVFGAEDAVQRAQIAKIMINAIDIYR